MDATHYVVIFLVVIASIFLVFFERSSRKNAGSKPSATPGADGAGKP